ncbi:MAG: hypothetical protein KDI37_00210 [Xanthomonadales bacterium]|nr:hypothetical protein [Xanthomonadales bacterium]
MRRAVSLQIVKSAHTLIWTFFVACIVGAPIAAWRGQFGLAWLMVALVACEALVLLFNHWSCPLTAVAARHTDDRGDNFDIYLPAWLARHNKTIFTPLYLLGVAVTVWLWWFRGHTG